jgi:hypothetical protein
MWPANNWVFIWLFLWSLLRPANVRSQFISTLWRRTSGRCTARWRHPEENWLFSPCPEWIASMNRLLNLEDYRPKCWAAKHNLRILVNFSGLKSQCTNFFLKKLFYKTSFSLLTWLNQPDGAKLNPNVCARDRENRTFCKL